MTSPDKSIDQQIREEIRRNGPIPFRRFMELALYHPRLGYYRRCQDPFGIGGDFVTNSQLQPVFGRLLAQQIDQWRLEMGSPADFTVVELGAGRGETSEVIRRCLPEVTCLSIDVSHGDLPQQCTGVVFSNEFFDALPVHRVERRGSQILEHFVGLGPAGFQWVQDSPSDPVLEDFVRRYAPGLGEGQKTEVNLAALEELEKIATSLKSGYLLTIDYGYTADEIAGLRRFPHGSLMSYEEQQATENVLVEPGNRDITAHLNFTALLERGQELGFRSLGLRTQAQFFVGIGQRDEFRAALQASGETESLRLRMQLKTLLFGMGETYRVLVQRK